MPGAHPQISTIARVYRITARTLEVTEQGHITDRYTKAIEQLGSDKLDVRLGGIYALERIAVDSRRDHPTVVEVLSAFVREHAQPPTRPSAVAADDANSEPTTPAPGPTPTTDVQAAVTVLGRLPRRSDVPRADLAGAHLEGAALYVAHLEAARLPGAHLEGTDLSGADLKGVDLHRADLKGADLTAAHLEKANLVGAHLEKANLTAAHLGKANLVGAHLEEAYLGTAPVSVSTPPEGAGLSDAPWRSWPCTSTTRTGRGCPML
jgi:hypothetical protein